MSCAFESSGQPPALPVPVSVCKCVLVLYSVCKGVLVLYSVSKGVLVALSAFGDGREVGTLAQARALAFQQLFRKFHGFPSRIHGK